MASQDNPSTSQNQSPSQSLPPSTETARKGDKQPHIHTQIDDSSLRPSFTNPRNNNDGSTRPSRQSSFLNATLNFTPLSHQSRKQFRQSYENLVALANAQEALTQTRRMVWRDRGEPAVELASVEEVFEHALRGGAREYIIFILFPVIPLVLWGVSFHVCRLCPAYLGLDGGSVG